MLCESDSEMEQIRVADDAQYLALTGPLMFVGCGSECAPSTENLDINESSK